MMKSLEHSTRNWSVTGHIRCVADTSREDCLAILPDAHTWCMECPTNYIEIDPRSHLEVADIRHRYSKNLRIYFQEYAKLVGVPDSSSSQKDADSDNKLNVHRKNNRWSHFQDFFKWLDGNEQVDLETCRRTKLETDTVLYLESGADRATYTYKICEDGLIRSCINGTLLTTDKNGWIFVLRDGVIYAHTKETASRPRFHHSTFLAGEPVEAAGLLVVEKGILKVVFPHSGHYRPEHCHLLLMLEYFQRSGIDLETVLVDAQRIVKSARTTTQEGVKLRKVDSPQMMNGATLLSFLRVKRSIIHSGTLRMLQSSSTSLQSARKPMRNSPLSKSVDTSFASMSSLTSPSPTTSNAARARANMLNGLLFAPEQQFERLSFDTMSNISSSEFGPQVDELDEECKEMSETSFVSMYYSHSRSPLEINNAMRALLSESPSLRKFKERNELY